ncbi:16S rRNA (cytosine(1402)-N(4))-methyltransferase [Salipaludibacillus neizhouensis]|uniref:16S rRNA (Cytosine(1402)-N(4))-methyltransferase n=1 Tax=Salipaludibacillus neizhouensis TaxID=885475 RepID=A0A3A9K3R8_9BACI|nr:class I SAM-dependent methyltransferase [Salipaludibacillus neizhouensis]RKL66979.1 16S rRNA (cytosine(1402)-N(4))-methyltransferase [Salipaludibacillus neizhouensis]
MKLSGVLPFARELLMKTVSKGAIVVDATAGNGHDTLFLAKLVGENGKVYSFDIQEKAIKSTQARLENEGVEKQVKLIHDSHDHLTAHLEQNHHKNISGAIFNLGYLPGPDTDKNVVTAAESTIIALHHLMENLLPEGMIVLVVYHGHEGGKREKEALLPFVRGLRQDEYHVLEYQFTNQRNNPPFIIAIEKR